MLLPKLRSGLLVLLLPLLPAALHATTYANITLEGAMIEADWDINHGSAVYKEKNLERNSVTVPWIGTPWAPNTSASCLRFQHNPNTVPGAIKQRTEYYAKRDLLFGGNYYIGFKFAAVGAASDLQNWTVISQSQQQGYYIEPIVNLNLTNNGGVMKLNVHIRNDNYHGVSGFPATGPYLQIWSQTITPGAWNNIVVRVKPDPTGTNGGAVEIWWNGASVHTYNGKLGYTLGYLDGPSSVKFTSSFQNTFGIYRAAQNSTFKMYFDNYRVANTYAEAAP